MTYSYLGHWTGPGSDSPVAMSPSKPPGAAPHSTRSQGFLEATGSGLEKGKPKGGPETPCCTSKRGHTRSQSWSHRKDKRADLKGLPLAKVGGNLNIKSMTTLMDYI